MGKKGRLGRSFQQIYHAQDNFVERMYSILMPCPLCATHFSLVSCHGGRDGFREALAKQDAGELTWDQIHDVSCESCGLRVRHSVTIMGGRTFWQIIPGQTVTYAGQDIEIGRGKVTVEHTCRQEGCPGNTEGGGD